MELGEMIITYLKVFLTGGLLCVIAQILIDKTSLTPARILVGYVVAGVVLTGIGVYQPIMDFGKAGASVPLTGFGYSLANGVKKAIDENGAIGIITGGLTGTAAGITVAICFGYLFALIFKPKMKKP